MSVENNGDPRSLAGEEYVPEQDLASEKADISHRLAELNTKLQVFDTPGWTLIADELRADVNDLIKRLVEGRVGTMEDIRELQGQIATARSVLDLPHQLQKDREECVEQLRNIQSIENPEQASP